MFTFGETTIIVGILCFILGAVTASLPEIEIIFGNEEEVI